MANDTRFGLAATLVTGDPDRAERVSARAERRNGLGQLLLRPRPGRTVRRQRPVRNRPRGRHWLLRLLLRHQEHRVRPERLDRPGHGHRDEESQWVRWSARRCSRMSRRSCCRRRTRRELNNGEDSHAGRGSAATAPGGLRDPRLRHGGGPGLALGDDGGVRRDRAATRRAGLFTSEELPRGMCAAAVRLPRRPRAGPRDRRRRPTQHGTWITAIDDDLPADLLRHHQPVGVPRPGPAGQAVDLDRRLPDRGHRGQPAARPGARRRDRRVRPQGRAHRLRRAQRTPSGRCASCASTRPPASSTSSPPEAAAADVERLEWFRDGDHARVLETMPEFYRFKPEARFGHYLMMIGALGEGDCTATVPSVRRVRELGRHRPGAPVVRPARRRVSPADAPGADSAERRPSRRWSPGSHDSRPAGSCSTATPSTSSGTGDALVAGDGRSVGVDEAVHLPPSSPSKIIAVHLNYRSRVEEIRHPAARRADVLSQADLVAQRARGRRGAPASGCKWLNYEGEIAIVIGRTCRNVSPEEAGDYIAGYTVGQRLRPARLPRHRRRLDAAGQGLRHVVPARTGAGRRLGLPRQAIRTLVNGEVRQDGKHRRDGVGHALPRRRHRPHDHPAARRRAAVRHPGDLAHRLPRRRRRGRGRGPRDG